MYTVSLNGMIYLLTLRPHHLCWHLCNDWNALIPSLRFSSGRVIPRI